MIGRDCVWNAFRMKKQRIKQVKQQAFRVERVFRRCSSSFGVGAQFKWGVIGALACSFCGDAVKKVYCTLHMSTREKKKKKKTKQSLLLLKQEGRMSQSPSFRSCSHQTDKNRPLTGPNRRIFGFVFYCFSVQRFFHKVLC